MENKTAIAILFGGCSTEYEVSLQSAYSVISHINQEKYAVHLVGITREGTWLYYEGDLDRIPDDTWASADCSPAMISPNRTDHGLYLMHGGEIELIRLDAVFPVLHGKNGCGKSSILKAVIQAAEEKAERINEQSMSLADPICYTGTITTAGGLKISYVPQDTSHLKGSLTDYAEKYELNLTSFLMLLRKLDLGREQFEKNMEDYSSGQKKKVLIARSLCEQAHLYIWDESLNFVDVFSKMQIEELLIKYRPTMLLVEHDAAFVEKVGTKIIEIESN